MTGGTIDAEPYPDPDHPPKDATMLHISQVPAVIGALGHDKRCDYLPWRAKDSKHYTPQDMQDLADIIRTSRASNIIITHGTDAMPENSRMVMEYLQHLEDDTAKFSVDCSPLGKKRVIFTGAMLPLSNGPTSDGLKNLDYIMKHIDGWDAGVRVVMHEQSFAPVGLTKDFSRYQFRGTVIPDAPQRGRSA